MKERERKKIGNTKNRSIDRREEEETCPVFGEDETWGASGLRVTGHPERATTKERTLLQTTGCTKRRCFLSVLFYRDTDL